MVFELYDSDKHVYKFTLVEPDGHFQLSDKCDSWEEVLGKIVRLNDIINQALSYIGLKDALIDGLGRMCVMEGDRDIFEYHLVRTPKEDPEEEVLDSKEKISGSFDFTKKEITNFLDFKETVASLLGFDNPRHAWKDDIINELKRKLGKGEKQAQEG